MKQHNNNILRALLPLACGIIMMMASLAFVTLAVVVMNVAIDAGDIARVIVFAPAAVIVLVLATCCALTGWDYLARAVAQMRNDIPGALTLLAFVAALGIGGIPGGGYSLAFAGVVGAGEVRRLARKAEKRGKTVASPDGTEFCGCAFDAECEEDLQNCYGGYSKAESDEILKAGGYQTDGAGEVSARMEQRIARYSAQDIANVKAIKSGVCRFAAGYDDVGGMFSEMRARLFVLREGLVGDYEAAIRAGDEARRIDLYGESLSVEYAVNCLAQMQDAVERIHRKYLASASADDDGALLETEKDITDWLGNGGVIDIREIREDGFLRKWEYSGDIRGLIDILRRDDDGGRDNFSWTAWTKGEAVRSWSGDDIPEELLQAIADSKRGIGVEHWDESDEVAYSPIEDAPSEFNAVLDFAKHSVGGDIKIYARGKTTATAS